MLLNDARNFFFFLFCHHQSIWNFMLNFDFYCFSVYLWNGSTEFLLNLIT